MIRDLAELRSRFQTRDHPDGSDFVDLIDTLAVVSPLSILNGHLGNGAVVPRTISPGTPLQHLRTSLASAVEWYDNSANEILISQSSSGLSLYNVVAVHPSGQVVKARAHSVSYAQPIGVITQLEADKIVVAVSGSVFLGSSANLTVGSIYYVDTTTPGTLTSVKPSSADLYVSPVLVASSATTGVLIIQATLPVAPVAADFVPVYFTTPRTVLTAVAGGTNSASLQSSNWQTADLTTLSETGAVFRFGLFSIQGDSGSLPFYISATLMRTSLSGSGIQGNGAVVHRCGSASGSFSASASVFMFPTLTTGGTATTVQYNIYNGAGVGTNVTPYSFFQMSLIGYIA